ncbi:MAG: pseudouridine synthase [Coprobacter fastidiosus]
MVLRQSVMWQLWKVLWIKIKGEVSSYLAENAAYEVYSTQNKDEGQYALTRYEVLKSNGKYSLVELQLATGRKNQIRVHIKGLGHSIIGDKNLELHATL